MAELDVKEQIWYLPAVIKLHHYKLSVVGALCLSLCLDCLYLLCNAPDLYITVCACLFVCVSGNSLTQWLHTLPHSCARVCGSSADVQQKTRSVSQWLACVKDLAVLRGNGLVYVGTILIGQRCFSCITVHFGIFKHTSTCKKNM